MSSAVAVTSAAPFVDADRDLTSVLAPLEKRCLLWIARRLPRGINADHLTGLAIVAMFLAGVAYWIAARRPSALWIVIACLAINWFGDSLDGTLARVRNQQRPRYGFYIDHVVDCAGVTFLIGGLGLSGYMDPTMASGVLVAYLLFSAEVYLATYALRTFRLTYFKMGPTELRIVLAIGNVMLLVHPTATILGHAYRLFDVGGLVAIIALVGTLLRSVIANTRALAKAEPRPPTEGSTFEARS